MVERTTMSIINKMHQDLNASDSEQPVLSAADAGKPKQKKLLVLASLVAIVCAVFLVVMIASETEQTALPFKNQPQEVAQVAELEVIVVEQESSKSASGNNQQSTAMNNQQQNPFVDPVTEVVVEPATPIEELNEPPKQQVKPVDKPQADDHSSAQDTPVDVAAEPKKQPASKKTTAQKNNQVKKAQTAANSSINKKAKAASNSNTLQSGQLNIETAQLSKQQLADIYLKEADKARAKGDDELAAEKWQKALNVQPKLNEVRKSLATYFYTQNDIKRSSSLLKKGALISPEYSDFNLMLARMALKEGDQQRAYLYLEQNPPQVEGHLDYYVTHAILAQKFQLYERSEQLYTSMLTQRPNNGRWLMSLAIAQDKQGKTEQALSAYQKALQQTDLSQKAKQYIKQRIVFLNKE